MVSHLRGTVPAVYQDHGVQAPLLSPSPSWTTTSDVLLAGIVTASKTGSVPFTSHTQSLNPFESKTEKVIPALYTSDAPHEQQTQGSTQSEYSAKLRDPQMHTAQRFSIASVLTTVTSFWSLSGVFPQVDWHRLSERARREKSAWAATPGSWLDRETCSWLGFCGARHWYNAVRKTRATAHQQPFFFDDNEDVIDEDELLSFWESGKTSPEDWSEDERVLREIPQYVIDYAPLVYLYSEEEFWPCDIAEHLLHIKPYKGYSPVADYPNPLNLTNLKQLNRYGRGMFLQSDDDPEDRPNWLGGKVNVPVKPDNEQDFPLRHSPAPYEDRLGFDEDSEHAIWASIGEGSFRELGGHGTREMIARSSRPLVTDEYKERKPLHVDHKRPPKRQLRDTRSKPEVGGRSNAPAILIVVDKGQGVVDAFWFFFYSFNLGNKVFGIRFGNHVGDWEHTAVRFYKGEPKAVYYSEHFFGDAYNYSAVEKIGKRPVSYSARGTHAMYATPGVHSYVLPWNVLTDVTDRGPLWDPALNYHSYTYNYHLDLIHSSNMTPNAPTDWFYFLGRWGDKQYPLSDPRQYSFGPQYHYEDGPTGPRYKNLGRRQICQGGGECKAKTNLASGSISHY